VADFPGTETDAAISPDGKFVTFVSDREGPFDIWLSQVGSGDFRNLTKDFSALQPTFSTFRKIGFSGDGAEIWFSPDTGPSMAQMIMPLMGGTPRAFLDKGATAPSWSTDGARLTYLKNEDGDPLFVADRTGADARQVLVEKGVHNHNPVWSSDGQWNYFARGLEPTDAMDVWRVRPSGESLEQLTERGTAVNFMAPLDTRTLLYVARAEDRSGPWLWALDVERKVTRRVSSGLGQYTSVSASRDGRRVVATVANPTSSLWLVPLLTWQMVITRIRNIAEHAVVPDSSDPLRNTRTTHANFLERLFIAPYYVNYHLEHHLLFYIPCYNLPRVHEILSRSHLVGRMETQPDYLSVLRLATGKPNREDRPGRLVNNLRRARAGEAVGGDQKAGGF
jgi:Tol biopolymer transport system component